VKERAAQQPPPIALRKDLMTLAPKSDYHSLTPSPTHSRPERRRVSYRTVIEEAKAKVSVKDLVERQASGKIRRAGAQLVTNCVLEDHEDRTPSFYVDPEKDVWFCHGCLRGGDVVELARFAWGYEKHEVAMAAADLLHEFGHPIPERPKSWYRKQKRQKPIRDAIAQARFNHLRRRLFRGLFAPSLLRIEDLEERKAEAAAFWEATEPLARMMFRRLAEIRS
jgi:DNA primase